MSWNVGNQVPTYAALHPKRAKASTTPQETPETSHTSSAVQKPFGYFCNAQCGARPYIQQVTTSPRSVNMRDKLSSVNENTLGKLMTAAIQLVFESQRETTRKN